MGCKYSLSNYHVGGNIKWNFKFSLEINKVNKHPLLCPLKYELNFKHLRITPNFLENTQNIRR